MSVEALQKEAEENTRDFSDAGESFGNSLMGKPFRPLIRSLLRYITINNQRLSKLEGRQNG